MKNPNLHWLVVVMTAAALCATAIADDAEIYYSQSVSADPNVLFLLDTSGSMDAVLPDSGGKTRMQVMQEVLGEVLSTAPTNLNVGLMRYGGHTSNSANGVSFPVTPIDAEALPIISSRVDLAKDNLPNPAAGTPVRQFLGNVANSWEPKGYTPIVDALYEATLYFRGGAVDAGYQLPNNVRAAHPASYLGSISRNACASYSNPKDCNNTWGECTGVLVDGSCHPGWADICTQWQQQTLYNQCCQWVATDYDESGKATGWECKNNNYSCTTTDNICTTTGQIGVELCQHQTCQSSLEGESQYLSPIQYDCQSNYLVLMSDGRPEYSGGNGVNTLPKRKKQIEAMTGHTCAASPSGYKSGTCGPELAQFLAGQDQAAGVDGEQTIQTFTVAFALDDPSATGYLASLATAADGVQAANDAGGLRQTFASILAGVASGHSTVASAPVAYTANQPYLLASEGYKHDKLVDAWLDWKSLTTAKSPLAGLARKLVPLGGRQLPSLAVASSNGAFTAGDIKGLTDAFTNILDKIDAAASSFSSPAYSVDRSNYLAHADEVFLPVFERSMLPLWSGNLKKFKLDMDGSITGQKGQLYGKNNKPATDSKGVMADDAWDFWADTASGKDVKAGGAASLLNPAARQLYTDAVAGVLSPLSKSNSAITLGLLFDDDANAGHGNNPSGCDPGNPGKKSSAECAAYRDTLLDFARGRNPDGSSRSHMGDVMNSRPLVAHYDAGDSYVLVGSNEGFLHAFDTETGQEKWAFMPASFLKNIDLFFQNNLAKTHFYGIDGGLGLWANDANGDGSIKAADHDHLYLYFGLRRGGRQYYALDITDINNPSILWKLDNTQTGFTELGESWSKPARARMRVAPDPTRPLESELREVLVFGAGFDPAKEEADPAQRQADASGRDVFIVDAVSGALLWSLRQHVSGASGQLQHSIPGDIRVLDMDRNGALDRLYFTDTGGNVWRVDMDGDLHDTDDGLYDYHDAKLIHVANLGGDGMDARKFYYEPDVALMQQAGQTIITIAVGSGYRSHPQSDLISDRFYVLLDKSPYQTPLTTTPITDGDLANTEELAGSSLLDTGYAGWYFPLPNAGEKVLAPASTFLNKVIFTTFANDGEVGDDPCQVPPNSARAYVLDLFNGQAVGNLDRSEDGSKERSIVIGVNEIPDAPQILFRTPAAANGSACTADDCQQGVEVRAGKLAIPVLDASNTGSGQGISGTMDISDILPRIFWRDNDVSAGH